MLTPGRRHTCKSVKVSINHGQKSYFQTKGECVGVFMWVCMNVCVKEREFSESLCVCACVSVRVVVCS
jgi:hypothetical protein